MEIDGHPEARSPVEDALETTVAGIAGVGECNIPLPLLGALSECPLAADALTEYHDGAAIYSGDSAACGVSLIRLSFLCGGSIFYVRLGPVTLGWTIFRVVRDLSWLLFGLCRIYVTFIVRRVFIRGLMRQIYYDLQLPVMMLGVRSCMGPTDVFDRGSVYSLVNVTHLFILIVLTTLTPRVFDVALRTISIRLRASMTLTVSVEILSMLAFGHAVLPDFEILTMIRRNLIVVRLLVVRVMRHFGICSYGKLFCMVKVISIVGPRRVLEIPFTNTTTVTITSFGVIMVVAWLTELLKVVPTTLFFVVIRMSRNALNILVMT